MYIIFPVILIILILCTALFSYRHGCIIKKIKCMTFVCKLRQLEALTRPLGFLYEPSQDIFVSSPDAWQRDYGYTREYDRKAIHFNMVFDCEPIYFDHEGCTWLLEFWKGQYGINTGAEIGLYKADRILSPSERNTAYFHTIDDCEMPLFSITLRKGMTLLFHLRRRHWWLAGFVMGQYTEPELLHMSIQILFPTSAMCYAFLQGLSDAGYCQESLSYCGSSVSFEFQSPMTIQPRMLRKYASRFAQWRNRLFLLIYCHATRPFHSTVDKLLYLYEYLPFTLRHIIRIQRRKNGRRKQ